MENPFAQMFSKNEADETKVEFHVTEVPATLPAHSGDTLKVISKVEEAVPSISTAVEVKSKRGAVIPGAKHKYSKDTLTVDWFDTHYK